MSEQQGRITIIGDGGWGTALALIAIDNGNTVTMWGHDASYLHKMQNCRENVNFFPGVALPEELFFEGDMEKAVDGADIVITAIPTKFLRAALCEAKGIIPEGAPVISLTKGIEQNTLKRPSEILEELLGTERIGVLSGPSHAEEVAARLPATVTVAAKDIGIAKLAQDMLMTGSFRIYTSTDVVGVELGGALKNVIALAAGIATGLGLGDNAMAALVTRGLAEITRLGTALGADPLTFAGLSGMGDLITTCISPHGRNRAVGLALGAGKKLDEILASMQMVAEGVTTAVSARDLARKNNIDMPITEEVYNILYENKSPRQAVSDLMSREGKEEN
ncbi:MAG: NAD(P)-dependent glycerol-3-phosphate dehydrogenase [Planctomycetes bacterium]|nr:NAD(P)-dependent glycerol-3-phosphate dehydrogenase [Planctomycetota bacterium]